jgi:hypothetical protein
MHNCLVRGLAGKSGGMGPSAGALTIGRITMNRSTVVGTVMITVAAMTVPVFAWSQSPPSPQSGMQAPDGPDRDGKRQGRGWRRSARNIPPQQACIDRIARHAAFTASIGFKLNLTADQKPLWDKLLAATQTAEENQRQLCAQLPASTEARDRETVIDRLNYRQQMLQAQLQALQQTQPAVQALYDKLTPDQKALFDRPFRRG